MNTEHYGLVIGLAKYPALGDPPPGDLKGPENDAAAMAAWLIDPAGGALPPKNVKMVSSLNRRPNMPGRETLEAQTFMWIEGKALQNSKKGRGRKVGQRLYFHLSGHGFSSPPNQGCLVMPNASNTSTTRNIGVTSWLQWWQDAGYFNEFVLTMDCCMNRMPMGIPGAAPLQGFTTTQPSGPSFVAFAAKQRLKAVEKPIPEADGRVHGVLTWAMLQGLRGAAVNDMNRVTGHSMAVWLRNAIQPWLDPDDMRDAAVSKLPEIVAEDDTLVLARGVKPLLFDTTVRFDMSCAGFAGRVWSGVPPVPEVFIIGQDGVARLQLRAGLHAVEVTTGATTWRQAFAVVRTAEVQVKETGAPVAQPTDEPTLTIAPGDPTADIRIVAADFRAMETGRGQVSTSLPFGIYRAAIQIGAQFVEQFIFLDAPWPRAGTRAAPASADALPPMPEIVSAAPLPGTTATHEYHQNALQPSAWEPDVKVGNGAELMIMARCFTPGHAESLVRQPWEGIVVLDGNGQVIADLSRHGRRDDTEHDPWAACKITVAPGTYTLRYPSHIGISTLERSLFVPPAADGGAPWRLDVHLLLRTGSSAVPAATRLVVSMFMHRSDALDWDADLVMEKARVALADERSILNGELAKLLFQGFTTSLASMIGGHLVLLGTERGQRSPVSLDEVVVNLRRLVGPDHPDVEALSLRCADPALRRIAPFTTPPLLERSWRLMVAASQDAPGLVPLALWQRVQAQVAAPPYLVWSADAVVQTSQSTALRETLLRETRDIARRASRARDKPAPMAALEAFGMAGRPERPSRNGHSAVPAPTEVSAAMHAHGKALGLPPAAVAALLGGPPPHERRH